MCLSNTSKCLPNAQWPQTTEGEYHPNTIRGICFEHDSCSKHIPRIPCLSISNDALFKNCQHPATRVINLFSRKILVRRSASTSTRGLASVLLVTSASISTPIRMEGQQSSFFTHFYSFKFDEQSPLSSDNTPSSLYF